MRGFRTCALVVVVIALLVVGRRTWFGVRQANARVEVEDPTPNTGRVLTRVLDATRRPELPSHGDRLESDLVVSPDPDFDPDVVAEGDLESSDGLTVEQRWEGTIAELSDRLAPGQGAFYGRVGDTRTNEDLAGVTVVATSPSLQGAQAAITDGQGFFAIGDLPVGEYLLTFYYLETTVERAGMRIEARQATPAFQSIEQPPPHVFAFHLDEVTSDADPDFDDSDDDDDGLGVSFSGVTSLENHYYVGE